MITDTSLLYLYVETPLHAGTGSGLSSIDLPIQRERTTQYPMIQSTGIKGKLRAVANMAAESSEEPEWKKEDVELIFGPEKDGAEHAGALITGDARILLFPVRSLSGVFAYTTSFDILNRFNRDLRGSQGSSFGELLSQEEVLDSIALVPENNNVTADNTIVLEEFSFEAQKDQRATNIANWLATTAFPQGAEYDYWRNKVKSSLIILPNNDFRDFVVNATEIITRVRINRETRTAAGQALWTEEHLPSDTLLYVPIYATNGRKESKEGKHVAASDILKKARSLETSQQGYLQLGGDETVGRGMVRMHWSK